MDLIRFLIGAIIAIVGFVGMVLSILGLYLFWLFAVAGAVVAATGGATVLATVGAGALWGATALFGGILGWCISAFVTWIGGEIAD